MMRWFMGKASAWTLSGTPKHLPQADGGSSLKLKEVKPKGFSKEISLHAASSSSSSSSSRSRSSASGYDGVGGGIIGWTEADATREDMDTRGRLRQRIGSFSVVIGHIKPFQNPLQRLTLKQNAFN